MFLASLWIEMFKHEEVVETEGSEKAQGRFTKRADETWLAKDLDSFEEKQAVG